MPSRPSKGARITLRSIWAWRAAASALVDLSVASSASSWDCAMTFSWTSLRERSAWTLAYLRRATTEASWARSTSASSSTRIWPFFTTWPESKRMALTTPAASLAMVTPRPVVMVPTAESRSSQVCSAATPDETISGGGPVLANASPAEMSILICENLRPASPPAITRRPSTAARYRIALGCPSLPEGFRLGSPPVRALHTLPLVAVAACAAPERRYPLREPLWRDGDLDPVHVGCRPDPRKPGQKLCRPREYKSS